MKLFAPKYYKKFSCIADKCKHSCCVGWEIDIDAETAEKYTSLEKAYGKYIKDSIDMSEPPHFVLGKEERCPHLNEKGLCKIIIELGEEYLCEICREHPRFYNDSPLGREVGIGMACEEAARIILSSDEYDVIEEIGDIYGDCDKKVLDTAKKRKEIFDTLKIKELSYDEKLPAIYDKFEISPNIFEDERWHELISSLEYLDEKHKELFLHYSSLLSTPKKIEKEAQRALAYFIYRHCTATNDEEEYRAVLGFCLFLERLFVSVVKANKNDSPVMLARMISEEIEYSEDNTERIINKIYWG